MEHLQSKVLVKLIVEKVNFVSVSVLFIAMIFASSQANAATLNVISGTHANNENGCSGAIPLIMGEDCSYNASNPSGAEYISGWSGPVAHAGYYATSLGEGSPTAGDGKINPLVSGSITVDAAGSGTGADDTLAGSITIGAVGARNFAGGPGLRGEDSWTTLTLSFGAETVSSAVANGSGGFDYVIASDGFPSLITNGAGDYFPSETASTGIGSFWLAPGTSGIAPIEGQVGLTPSLAFTGYSCADTIYTGACADNSLAALIADGATANLILAVSTGATGNIISGTGIWALQFDVLSVDPSPDSYLASSFTFAAVPVPAAIWLFGSALGLFGWMRRLT